MQRSLTHSCFPRPFLTRTRSLQQSTPATIYESQTATTEMTEAEQEELAVRKRRAEGTPCTKENFEAWQAQFLAEMAETAAAEAALQNESTAKRKQQQEKVVDKTGRLTGYQQFMEKMGDLEALEAAAEQVEEQEFDEDDEELFEDDVDVDDLDFSDDEDEDGEDANVSS